MKNTDDMTREELIAELIELRTWVDDDRPIYLTPEQLRVLQKEKNQITRRLLDSMLVK